MNLALSDSKVLIYSALETRGAKKISRAICYKGGMQSLGQEYQNIYVSFQDEVKNWRTFPVFPGEIS